MSETIEDLESELDIISLKIDIIAEKVAKSELDSYEGFVKTQEYHDRIAEIILKLKELGVDIIAET